MLGILGAAVEGASGTREDGKEALEVSVSPGFKIHWFTSECVFVYSHAHVVSSGPSSVFKIVKMIMERNFQPVIIFSFSKKECEAYALQVAKLDFNRGMCYISVCNCALITTYVCNDFLYFACHSTEICNEW